MNPTTTWGHPTGGLPWLSARNRVRHNVPSICVNSKPQCAYTLIGGGCRCSDFGMRVRLETAPTSGGKTVRIANAA